MNSDQIRDGKHPYFPSSIRRWHEVVIVALFFVISGLYVFGSILSDDYTLALPGDGRGSVAWIFDFIENLRARGVGLLLGDTYRSETIGGNLARQGHPMAVFWKLNFTTLAQFVDSWQVYDYTVYIGYVLAGLFGFVLTRELGSGFLASFVAACFFASSDIIYGRMGGHLTLSTYYCVILSLWLSWRAAIMPTKWRLIGAGWGICACFQIAEYYGYFSALAGVALFVSVSVVRGREFLAHARSVALWLPVAAIVFVLSMALLFPHLIGAKLLPGSGSDGGVANHYQYHPSEYDYYSVKYPKVVFRPRIELARQIAPESYREAELPREYTFHLGFFLFVLVSLGLLANIAEWVRARRVDRFQLAVWVGFLTVAIMGICLSANTIRGYSMVPFTQKFAPMFRVSTRGLVLTNAAFMALVAVAVSALWRALKSEAERRAVRLTLRACATAAIALGVGAAYADFSVVSPKERVLFMQTPRPHFALYEALAPAPNGMTLILPYYYAHKDRPETDYDYYLSRTYHRKPILNGLSFRSEDYMSWLIGDYQGINNLDAEKIEKLREAGIRYVIVNAGQGIDESALSTSDIAKLYHESDQGRIYEIQGALDYTRERFLQHLGEPQLKPLSPEGFTAEPPDGSRSLAEWNGETENLRAIESDNDAEYWFAFLNRQRVSQGTYSLTFGVAGRSQGDPGDLIATIDVIEWPELRVLAARDVAIKDLGAGDFFEVTLRFDASGASLIEPRIRVKKAGVFVLKGPVELRAIKTPWQLFF